MARSIPMKPDFEVGRGAERSVWETFTAKLPLKNPVAQSQSAMHAFKKMVQSRGIFLECKIVYLVAFPFTQVSAEWEMTGVPRQLVLDADDLLSPRLEERLASVIRTESKDVGAPRVPVLERLTAYIAGDDDGAFASVDPDGVRWAEEA